MQRLGGCCGLAGNFGVEKGHYEVSVAVADQQLRPAVAAAPADTEILAEGLDTPVGIAITPVGEVLVSESGAGRVVTVAGGRSRPLIEGLVQPQGLLVRDGTVESASMFMAPTAFTGLIDADHTQPRATWALRHIIFAGEALHPPTLAPWIQRYGDQHPQLINMYGITETTIHATYRPITTTDLNTTTSPIGQPIPDLRLYLLDPHGNPVPIGVTGEMSRPSRTISSRNKPSRLRSRFSSMLRPIIVEPDSTRASRK